MEQVKDTLTGIYDQIQPYLAKTVFIHSSNVDEYVHYLSSMSGLRDDAARIVITTVLSYPLCYIHAAIKSPKIKKLMSIIFGVIILQFCFGEAYSVVVYLLMLFAPHKYEPYIIFIFTMLYMSICMIYSLVTDYMGWSCDSTVYQMILVIRLSSLGFDYFDGVYDRKNQENIIKNSKNAKLVRTCELRRATRINALPSLLDYFAYCYHFAGLLGGPTIFYREYLDVVNNKTFPNGKIPKRFGSVLLNIVNCAILFALWIYLGSMFSPQYLITEEYGLLPFWKQYIILSIACISQSLKYMATWKLGEGVCVANGFGSVKTEKGIQWTGVSNVNVFKFLLSQDMGEATKNWNLRTQKWLSRYVYFRTGYSLLCVYIVSAFWHGFYPGYYISFLFCGVCQYASRFTKTRLYNRIKDNYYLEKIYCRLANIMTMFYGCYCVNAHFLLSLENAKKYYGNLHYIPHIALLIALCILMIIPPKKDTTKEKMN
ncbi:hypothetical protein WA158_002296 [Blastocystis sp. Blastoise]